MPEVDRVRSTSINSFITVLFLAASVPAMAQAGGSTVAVSITPTAASVAPAKTVQFAATVTGTSNTAVNWTVNGKKGGSPQVGTINSSGLYTAPKLNLGNPL